MLLRHLEPALDMLEAAIQACPEHIWQRKDTIGPAEHVYHTVSSVDFWIRDLAHTFQPPPFHDENAAMMSGPAPKALDKGPLLAYLNRMRAKCHDQLSGSDQDLLAETEIRGSPLSLADRCLSQIRHVQHHVGVLHRMVCEETTPDLPWREHARTTGDEPPMASS